MQNRYTGDIGDYAKYGLLRALADGQRLAWRGHDHKLFDVHKG